jgi:pimeloyl-ACP methyl ester carboxylesterase
MQSDRIGRMSRSHLERRGTALKDSRQRQSIRYVRTADRVGLAWAEAGAAHAGQGVELAHPSRAGVGEPVWRHWIRFFAERFRFVRYDERGCGMSDWEAGDLDMRHWLSDLETVIAAAAPEGPLVLLGISQGTAPAIQFAALHPERVSHLILYGGYSEGWARRGDEGSRRRYQAMVELIDHGWGGSNPVFRQLFTSRFIPGGTDEQLAWFNELCRKTTSPRNAARLLAARAHVDVRGRLPQVRVPTLVLHARHDEVVPIKVGRVLATEIPGATFVELDSANHILLEGEPAWARFCQAVEEFTGMAPSTPVDGDAFAGLSPREHDDPGLITEGLGTPRSASAWGSARRRCGTTSRTCSTSSASGAGRRRSCSPGTGVRSRSVKGGRAPVRSDRSERPGVEERSCPQEEIGGETSGARGRMQAAHLVAGGNHEIRKRRRLSMMGSPSGCRGAGRATPPRSWACRRCREPQARAQHRSTRRGRRSRPRPRARGCPRSAIRWLRGVSATRGS